MSDAYVWPGLELRHLHTVLTVAETGSFTAAADRLGYTQSAVSQQVAALERIVGTPLFERPGGPRPVQLTEVGHAFREHADAIVRRARAAEADLRALAGGDRGALRVGTIQSVGTNVLPSLIRRFSAEHPGVTVALRESQLMSELLRWLEIGEIDATFVESSPIVDDAPPWLEVQTLLEDPYVFVTSAEAPEAERSSITLAEVVAHPLASWGGGSCHGEVVSRLSAVVDSPEFVFRSDDNPTVQGFIAAGLACGLLPLLTLNLSDPHTAIVPLDPPVPPRHLGLGWHRGRRRPAALAAFLATAADVCAHVEDDQRLMLSSRFADDRSTAELRGAGSAARGP
jgi:DNA-binding transcriptional LysR family regulator